MPHIPRAPAGAQTDRKATGGTQPAALEDRRSEAAAYQALAEVVHAGPRMVAQRALLDTLSPRPAASAALPVQLFTRLQVTREAEGLFRGGSTDHDKNWIDAKRILFAREYPSMDAEATVREAWDLRRRYMAGEELVREQYRVMARGLCEEELAEAAEERKKTVGYAPTFEAAEDDEDAEEGDGKEKKKKKGRAWASGPMDKAITALREAMPQFTTGHHKVSKSKLALAVEKMSYDQREQAKGVLDLASDSGVTAFKSLGSDVSSGPNSGLRLDERGRAPDVNRDASGAMTPRSTIYAEIDLLLDTIIGTPPSGRAELPGGQYEELMSLLVRVEKVHYLKTRGDLFDRDVTMWLEVPTEPGKPSFWVRKSVPAPYVLELSRLADVTVRELKKGEYQAKRRPKPTTSPTPELFSEEHFWMGDGWKQRGATNTFGGATTEEGRRNWAKSGYKRREGEDSTTYERIDPGHLRKAFGLRLVKAKSVADVIDPAGPVGLFNEILDLIVAQREGALRESGVSMFEFDKIRPEILERCGRLRERLGKLGEEHAAAGAALAAAAGLVDLVTWFSEGEEGVDVHAAQIEAILNAVETA